MGRASNTRCLLEQEKRSRCLRKSPSAGVHTLGWQDGYKNVAERVVAQLGQRGKPVAGLLGPWGHKYAFDGYPGPPIAWLRYITDNWWNRWLKGRAPKNGSDWPQLTVSLPVRSPRREDAGAQKLLAPTTEYVNPEQYVSTTEYRPAAGTRTAQSVVVDGKDGALVKKVFDSGRTVLGGALEDLSVDQVIREEIQILQGEPLSMSFSGTTESTFTRGNWKARSVTHSRLWSERTNAGEVVFKYDASAQAFADDRLIAENRVEGTLPRQWI